MKTQFIIKTLLLLTVFVLSSCSTEDKKPEDLSNSNVTFESIMKTNVGKFDNNVIKLDYSDEDLIKMFKDFATKINLDVTPIRVEVLNQDSKFYLRFYNSNNTVSTIALIQNEINTYGRKPSLELGTTVCTSTQCATGGGCLPNGDYCTECVPPNTQPGSGIPGDCTRTTSG